MLALVWIAAPALVLAMGALLCLILGLFYVLYLQPALDWLSSKEGGFFKRIVFWPVRKAAEAVRRFVRGHVRALLRAYVTRSGPLVSLLNNLAELTGRVAGTIGDLSEQTWRALWTLRHVTVPALIANAVRPVLLIANQALVLAQGAATTLTAMMADLRTTLRALPWGGALVTTAPWTAFLGSYRNLWDVTFKTLVPRVTELWNNRVPNLRARLTALENYVTTLREDALPAIRQRLGKIETRLDAIDLNPLAWIMAALTTAAGVAAIGALLRTVAPNLFCRNVTSTTQRICAQDEAMWAQLLAGTLLWALVLDPRALARVAEGATEVLDDVIRATALR